MKDLAIVISEYSRGFLWRFRLKGRVYRGWCHKFSIARRISTRLLDHLVGRATCFFIDPEGSHWEATKVNSDIWCCPIDRSYRKNLLEDLALSKEQAASIRNYFGL